jgi:hypothetical protein
MMLKDRVFQVVRVLDEDGTTGWFWTNQPPDEEIEGDDLPEGARFVLKTIQQVRDSGDVP